MIATLFILGIYFLPGIIASARGHHNALAIWVLSLFLGWTTLGWIIALVWSFTSPRVNPTIVVTQVITGQPTYYQQQPPAQLPAPQPQSQLPEPWSASPAKSCVERLRQEEPISLQGFVQHEWKKK
jgi:uncharacterized iron-regulated membrane protein